MKVEYAETCCKRQKQSDKVDGIHSLWPSASVFFVKKNWTITADLQNGDGFLLAPAINDHAAVRRQTVSGDELRIFAGKEQDDRSYVLFWYAISVKHIR